MKYVTPTCAHALVTCVLVLAMSACAGSVPEVATVSPSATVGDLDGDGIADENDRCVRDPEDVDGYLDEDGCPDPDDDCADVARTAPGARRDTITESIAFEPGTTTILPEAYPVLAGLGTSLRTGLHAEHVVVVGLADASEPDPAALSLARAERVRDFLVAHGVDRTRLDVLGAGARDPVPVVAPFPATHPPHTVWFVVEQVDGVTRYVLRDGVFVALDVTPGVPGTSSPRTAPRCP